MPDAKSRLPIIRVTTRIIGCIGIGILMANVFLHMFDIGCRWLLSMPQSWVADIYELTLPVAIASCFPLTVAHRGMISIEFLGNALGGWPRQVLNLLGALALLAVLAVITWQCLVYSNDASSSGRATFLLNIPLAPTWYVSTIFFAFSTLVQAVMVITVDAAKGERESMEGI